MARQLWIFREPSHRIKLSFQQRIWFWKNTARKRSSTDPGNLQHNHSSLVPLQVSGNLTCSWIRNEGKKAPSSSLVWDRFCWVRWGSYQTCTPVKVALNQQQMQYPWHQMKEVMWRELQMPIYVLFGFGSLCKSPSYTCWDQKLSRSSVTALRWLRLKHLSFLAASRFISVWPRRSKICYSVWLGFPIHLLVNTLTECNWWETCQEVQLHFVVKVRTVVYDDRDWSQIGT